jgi:hypothetical protein
VVSPDDLDWCRCRGAVGRGVERRHARSRRRATPPVPFSDLLRHLDRGEVAELIVAGDTLDFKLSSGRTFRTVAPLNYVTLNPAFVTTGEAQRPHRRAFGT